MAITVGTDTYVTVAQANDYIAKLRLSGDTQRSAWDAASDAEKEVYLRNALQNLERLSYGGRKFNGSAQALSFPRVYAKEMPYRRSLEADTVYPEGYSDQTSTYQVPEDIKNAQIEEALEICSPSVDTQRQNIRKGAVESYSIGSLSESYALGNNRLNSVQTVLCSSKAQELIMPYVGGGYRVV